MWCRHIERDTTRRISFAAVDRRICIVFGGGYNNSRGGVGCLDLRNIGAGSRSGRSKRATSTLASLWGSKSTASGAIGRSGKLAALLAAAANASRTAEYSFRLARPSVLSSFHLCD